MNEVTKGVRLTPPPFFTRARFYSSLFSAWILNLGMFGVKARNLCGPAFNCHACPWSTFACPIGVFTFSSSIREFPTMAVGFILSIAVLSGRLVCSFVCPFGLLQEILYRAPVRKLRLPRILNKLKYAALLLLVFLLPFLLGFTRSTELYLYFCKTCPNGTLTGSIPALYSSPPAAPATAPAESALALEKLLSGKEPLKSISEKVDAPNSTGTGKTADANESDDAGETALSSNVYDISKSMYPRLSILGVFLLLMLFISRPFCRMVCPLGAIFGLFHKLSIYRVEVELEKCISCGACHRVCPVELDVPREANGPECIMCGECARVCPIHIIRKGIL
jgi:ferredoxin-type protein NapH